MIKWEVLGTKQIMLKLGLMEKKVRGKIIRGALRQAANIVKKKARDNAPKESGLIRKQIKIKTMKRKVNRIGITVQLNATAEGEWYSQVVEWGRKKIRPFEGRRFLKRAFDETKEQCEAVIKKELLYGAFGILKGAA